MTLPNPKPGMVVLGLDGVSWTMIRRLTGQGLMPNLAALLREAQTGPMASTLPEISPVAWTTFFTARSPGEHGIYGFTEFQPGTYRVRLNSSADVRTPCLWDWLSLRERRSVVLNVPLTYPARPLSGVMVSGFVALDYQRAAYPPALAGFLQSINYRLEADFERVHQDREAFLEDLKGALAGRSLLLDRFWPEPWELFVLVVTDTDRLQHFFLREFTEDGPITPYFLDFFRRVDDLVGEVADRTARQAGEGRDMTLVMLSDHGFAPVHHEFHLNHWLAARGLLPDSGPGPQALALALDPTRIYLNRPPRFPEGRLPAGDVDAVIFEIMAGLTSEPAVAGVSRGRDIYAGPAADLAPTLVVRPQPGYEFKAKFTTGPVYTDSPLQGAHTFDDAFFLIKDFNPSPGPEAPSVRDILDLGRLVSARLKI
jgi:predicted AlkP superfamily phosphohydrolase/phosphomutase